MDKETLSNYGWIVICVLVLVVMIALATPFGSYISSAVKSTTAGLFETNRSALNSTGLIKVGEQQFDGDPIVRSGIIPDGATYRTGGTTLEGNGTNTFPETPRMGDEYKEGDYIYIYNKRESYSIQNYGYQWNVETNDKTKTEYGEILSEIAGKPVTCMSFAFRGCTSLTTAPTIPNGVTMMEFTFWNCTSLTIAPIIPSSVTNMTSTFSGCTSLTTAPTIPNRVTSMKYTFSDCTSLTTAPTISNSVTNMTSTFSGCTSLTTAPTLPSSVTMMTGTFSNCTSLTTAPTIPNGVKYMDSAFQNCTSLTTAPTIPSSVTNMHTAFWGCTLLKDITITIPSSVFSPSGKSGSWENGPSWIRQ